MTRPVSANKSTKPNGVSDPIPEALPETGNLDKVRDILFGQQSREMERRLERMDERLRADLHGLQRDGDERQGVLEAFVRQELQALKDRLASESEARLELAERTARAAEAERSELERKLSALQDRHAAAMAEAREALLEQGKRFTAELKALREQLQATLEREVSALKRDKLDRSLLARGLADVALLVGGDGDERA
jgi:DNA mismatch repair ATPase MutS